MTKERFDELCEAIRQAKAVRRGVTAPSRVWEVKRSKGGRIIRRQLDPEAYRRKRQAEWVNTVAATRARMKLSQSKFADLMGVSVKTLHNWEQGRGKPTGAARVLLSVAALHPEVVLEAVA